MYVVRDIFNTKPGKAKELVKKFKKSFESFKQSGFKVRIMTDTVSTYWTVVLEIEVEDLKLYFDMARERNPEMEKAMEGYMELVKGGRREIFKVE
ncbi:hypothetical protein QWY93_08990 [Echinicola jeungdonensis]|uniref:Uncharacterized protein n=1 Tax=Echinicola jeungdonensis TaxID=709343 RepID=A0ABV5J8V3_9BACT|nr:hypothetical protein [Echinicola jeungdonensis]MDN3669465.1 hypothetical protein [Echinicola jeungdonensis]